MSLNTTTEPAPEVTPGNGQKKRVLYVITKAKWGGAQRYVYDLATAARAAGHAVLVVSGPGEMTERLAAAGVEIAPIASLRRDIRLSAEVRAFDELSRSIRAFRPDVVHLNSSKAGGLGALAARLCGVPRIIFTAHGWAFNEDRPAWQKVLIWLSHYATVLLAHTTVCVSAAVRHDARLMPFVQKRFRLIRNGTHPIDFIDRDTARATLAPALSQSLWIGTIAELHPVKQLDVLIRAFASLAKQHTDIALIVMGEGQERARLEALIRELGCTDRVRLCGHVSEAPRYLHALDIFVLPSRSEALAFVLLEAGMASLPVVASRAGGIPEVIEDGVTGILVPSADVDALTAALASLLADAQRRRTLGDALYARVVNDFSNERMVRETLALY